MTTPGVPPAITAARTLVSALVDQGVRDVVLAPGSRSAPLAYALADAADNGALRLHVRIDERSAGFLALGLAKGRSGAEVSEVSEPPETPTLSGLPGLSGHCAGPQPPVAIVTTSGTAAANLLPALLEAHHSGVPLLALTADRPHELRGTGANQTTDQVGMFGAATRFAADVPAPSGLASELTDLVSVSARAVAAASGTRTGHPGPAHLNLSYRDPLAPPTSSAFSDTTDDGPVDEATVGEGAVGENEPGSAVPNTGTRHGPRPTRIVNASGVWSTTTSANWPLTPARTIVVAGGEAGPIARELAENRGWPLLAESVSGALGGPNQVLAHVQVLLHGDMARDVERVIVLGRPTLSRPVQRLLARPEVEVLVVAPGTGQWPDAARNAAVVLPGVPAHWLEEGQSGGDAEERVTIGGVRSGWLSWWRAAGFVVAKAVQDDLAPGMSGPRLAHELVAALKPEHTLVVGSSNPVRDLDLVADWHEPPRIIANRGLAGIDGLVSTATGVALAAAQNGTDAADVVVRALIGDLTLLHDVGGLLRAPGEPEPNLQIIVANDRGGSIFAGLEHGALGETSARRGRTFERVFATPHAADLAALCAGYGVAHTRVDDVGELARALGEPPKGVSVLEVGLGRADRREAADRLTSAVRDALGEMR